MPANYFDERIAKSYAAKWPDLFEPAMVEPCVRHNCRIRGDLQPQNCYGKTVIASISVP